MKTKEFLLGTTISTAIGIGSGVIIAHKMIKDNDKKVKEKIKEEIRNKTSSEGKILKERINDVLSEI